MNEYFKILQKVNESSTELLEAKYYGLESVEIQDAAKSLQDSVKPCFDELKESALKLKQLINASLKTLDHAEDVWQSKQRIAEASQSIIWEQVADLTATHVRIKQKIKKNKESIVNKNENLLTEKIYQCKKEFFTDKKKETLITAIGWGDKDKFNKYIQSQMLDISEKTNEILLEFLRQDIYEVELGRLIDSSKIESYIILFDAKISQVFTDKFNYFFKFINEKFCGSLNVLGGKYEEKYIIQNLYDQATPILTSWQKRLTTISWNEVSDFEERVKGDAKSRIELILDDRLNFVINVIEEAIDFCNIFLELQNRYRQETSEKRLAEKTWIDNQRQLLNKIQEQILKIIE